MTRIPSRDLQAGTAATLRSYQQQIDAQSGFEPKVREADIQFKRRNKASNPVFREIRRALTAMCAGARRCMYSEDSVADEVEHHRPKNLFPDLAFVWPNYLYACGPCNGRKLNRFAVFTDSGLFTEIKRSRGAAPAPSLGGSPVLLQPRADDPFVHMMLDIRGGTFWFVPLAEKGSSGFVRANYTIALLGLNDRDYLPAAREDAYQSYRARLKEYADDRDAGADKPALNFRVDALKRMPHPTVWMEMRRQHLLIPKLETLFRRVPEAFEW